MDPVVAISFLLGRIAGALLACLSAASLVDSQTTDIATPRSMTAPGDPP
jgi:hypothetical protein